MSNESGNTKNPRNPGEPYTKGGDEGEEDKPRKTMILVPGAIEDLMDDIFN